MNRRVACTRHAIKEFDMKRLLTALICLLLLTGCTSTSQDVEQAHQTLFDFFEYLNTGRYEEADLLYGGTYEMLSEFAPSLDANDHAALWRNGCQISGLQCLLVRSAQYLEQTDDILVFNVEFKNADGTLFVRRPCCGADEAQMPSASQFAYRVQKTPEGKYLVLDLPVYLP
jgi:hypothetical protein